MTGPAGHAMRLAASAADRFLDLLDEKSIHGYGALVEQNVLPQRQAAAFHDIVGHLNKRVRRAVEDIIGFVANVQRNASFRGNDVGRPGFRAHLTNCGYEAWVTLRGVLDGHDPFRGCGDGVMPKMHGSRTRVIGAAQKHELHAGLSSNGIDRSEGPADGFEDRSLLDVKFQITECALVQGGTRNVGGIQAKLFDGRADSNSVRVTAIQKFLIEGANQSATADET